MTEPFLRVPHLGHMVLTVVPGACTEVLAAVVEGTGVVLCRTGVVVIVVVVVTVFVGTLLIVLAVVVPRPDSSSEHW